MEFRWVALIALWTLLSGPVLDMRQEGAVSTRKGKASSSNAAPIGKFPASRAT